MSQPTQRVELSTYTIAKFFLVPIALWLLWYLRDILALLFLVMIIVASLTPPIRFLEKQGIPKLGAVTLLYAIGALILVGLFSMIVPPLVEQIRLFVVQFPLIVERVTPLYRLISDSNAQQILNSLSSSLSNLTQGVLSATVAVFGGAISAMTVLVLSFYLLVDADKTKETLIALVPLDYRKTVTDIIVQTGEKLGAWLRGQLVLSLLIGSISFLGLLVLQVDFALTLAVLAGILEIIPFLGPIIAALAAVFVAYASGTWQIALVVLAFYIVLQQVESHVLVPKVMESAVGLSPIIVVIALAIGAKLGGITGAVLAVPLAATVSVIARDLHKFRIRRPS